MTSILKGQIVTDRREAIIKYIYKIQENFLVEEKESIE